MLIDRNVPLAPPGMGCVQVGPTSVSCRLTSETLSFGAQQCTATDVAIASGVAPGNICVSEECQAAVHRLSPSRVYVAMRSMRLMLEAAIDSMKVEKEDVPVLLVGGGSTLVDLSVPPEGGLQGGCPSTPLVGVTLQTVGGASDQIMNLLEIQEGLRSQGVEEGAGLDHQTREVALERGRENARRKARDKAPPLQVQSKQPCTAPQTDVSDMAYVSHQVRVKVKAIRSLETSLSMGWKAQPSPPPSPHPHPHSHPHPHPHPMLEQLSQDNPHWPNCSAEDRARDEAAGLPPAHSGHARSQGNPQ